MVIFEKFFLGNVVLVNGYFDWYIGIFDGWWVFSILCVFVGYLLLLGLLYWGLNGVVVVIGMVVFFNLFGFLIVCMLLYDLYVFLFVICRLFCIILFVWVLMVVLVFWFGVSMMVVLVNFGFVVNLLLIWLMYGGEYLWSFCIEV